jgi:hypothetical protein
LKTKKRSFFLFILLFGTFLTMNVSAQDDVQPQPVVDTKILYHNKGDMCFSMNLGVNFTLFLQDISTGFGEITNDNISAGGLFLVGYDVYLSQRFKLGLQVAPSFFYSANKNILYLIPVIVRATYEIQPIRAFSIPLTLGVGPSFNSYRDEFHIDLLVKPGVGFYWNKDVEWSFGLDVGYWWMTQLYNDSEYNRILNALELSLSAHYYF